MTALVIVAVTLVPVLARMTAVHARGRQGAGENRPRLLKAEGQETGSALRGLEERDRLEKRRQEIAAVRAARHAAVRRRRAAVLVLLVLCAVLLGLSFVIRWPWWFCLLPLVAVAAVLAEGTVSAAKARRFERSVCDAERSARRTHVAAKAASSVTAPVDPHAEGPQSRPIRSVRQVARAVPLTGQERRRVLADVTPSVPLPAAADMSATRDVSPDKTRVPSAGDRHEPAPASGNPGDRDGRVTLAEDRDEKIPASGSRDGSLSSDLSAILSRRNS